MKPSEAPVKKKKKLTGALPEKKGKKKKKKAKSAPVESSDEKPPEKKVVKPVLVDNKATALAISNVVALTGSAAVNEARKMFRDMETTWLRFGALMSNIRDRGDYKEEGYATWKDFVETEFRQTERHTRSKVEVYRTLVLEGKQAPGKVEAAGSTKCTLLVAALTSGLIEKAELGEWLEKAAQKTEKDLKSELNFRKKPPTGEKGEAKQKDTAVDFNARVIGEEGLKLLQATKTAVEAGDKEEISGAEFLLRLCAEFMASNISKEEHKASYYCRMINTAYPDQYIFSVPKTMVPKLKEFMKTLVIKKSPDGAKQAVKKVESRKKKKKKASTE